MKKSIKYTVIKTKITMDLHWSQLKQCIKYYNGKVNYHTGN